MSTVPVGPTGARRSGTNVESEETMQATFLQSQIRSRLNYRNSCRNSSMGYKLAIFDFDGTLADSISWFLDVINEVADTYSFRRINEQELPALRSYDAKRIIHHLGIPMWKVPLVQRHLRRRMACNIGRISLFPGIDTLLQRLHAQGIVLAIVTSNSSSNVCEVLGRQNASLIQHYACDAQLLGKRVKLRKVLHNSGFLPSEAIFIGDEIRDLRAAHAEDVAFGAVPWGANNAESLSRHFPEESFSSVEEIAWKITTARRSLHLKNSSTYARSSSAEASETMRKTRALHSAGS